MSKRRCQIAATPIKKRHHALSASEMAESKRLLRCAAILAATQPSMRADLLNKSRSVTNFCLHMLVACRARSQSDHAWIGVLLMRQEMLEQVDAEHDRIPRPPRRAVAIANYSSSHCWTMFRFRRPDLVQLLDILRFPATVQLPNKCVSTNEEVLLITLRRLSYPGRLLDLEQEFGIDYSIISRIFNFAVSWIYDHFHHLWSNGLQHWAPLCEAFHEAVVRVSGVDDGVRRIVGFVDGTFRKTARPSGAHAIQRAVYSGHKRGHGLHFQAVVLPNGIIADVFGPITGRHHDGFSFRRSRVEHKLEMLNALALPERGQDQRPFALYGDAAYAESRVVERPTQFAPDDARIRRNAAMASARVAVENAFADVTKLFAFCDYHKNLKLLQQPVGKIYPVCAFMYNLHTCCYGSEITTRFGMKAPSMHEYVRLGAVDGHD